ncbi:alpha/beta hydrolase [Romboutsia weinsteinii]|nr:alpha/beta hydrolase [Romboutsia weinsteinii]
MKEDVKVEEKRLDETLSITMELERPLLYNAELKNSEEIENKNKKSKINILKIVASILLAVIIGFFIWASNSYTAQDLAKESLISDEFVEVNRDDFISFTPKNIEPTKGFIFYPGAKVESESYAPLCREIAKKGYEVVIADMPFNLAVLGPNKAKNIMKKYDNIHQWVIGGHSLGGVMAAKFASKNNLIDGVVLLASYPSGDELKNLGKNVLSIWGSKDGVVNFENLIKSKDKLPINTKYVEIEGANHAQFGDYGKQKKDNDAIISEEKQLDITADSIIEFLEKIN